ncbi:MAG TPA: hypothetical protein IGR64_09325 [Leptolyngbyaceae cyanobacterium M65_K2018_010]|nr:hypothetical protein [Leptolyngbyaceae cyanobacterium M65_K2018_010]
MKPTWMPMILPLGLCLGALGAYGLEQSAQANDSNGGMPTTIVLPDGSQCFFAGQGATLTYQGQRLNYSCGDTLGLMGDVTFAQGTEITLQTATLDGTTITGITSQTLTISSVELADGTTCTNTAETNVDWRSIQDKPLYFFCGDADTVTGLTGTITDHNGILTTERITREGFDRGYTDTVNIVTLTTTQP